MAVTKSKIKQTKKKEVVFDASVLSTANSYLALAYGALTVLVLFFALFLVVKLISQRNIQVNNSPAQSIGEVGISTRQEPAPTKNTYIVVVGDSLWSIAQTKYNDGYKWTEIAKNNNIENPNIIEKGQKLIIPDIKPSSVTQGLSSAQNSAEKIIGPYYTVVEGDNLWTIAVRAYGDGYKWVDIANRNRLVTPDIIHPGNKFVLPR